MRWHTSSKLHAHTADACIQAFFASLASWRERKRQVIPMRNPAGDASGTYFRIDTKKRGSQRRKKLVAAKQRQLKKLKNQISDSEHGQTSTLITTLHQAGVQTLLIGDVRSKVQGRVFRCPKCKWTYHRDGVGSINIRQKYLGSLPVVGAMAAPIGVRYHVHAGVARSEKEWL